MNATLAFAAAVAASTFASAQEAVQWRVEDGGNGHWYQVVTGSSACWTDMALEAEAIGGHLATITSSPEDSFISSLDIKGFLNVGGFQDPDACEPSCGWEWVTGEVWDFARWAPGQPENYLNQDYLVYTIGGWHDGSECPPYTGSGFIIEFSADCNGDGIVDYGQTLDGTFADINANGVPDNCECFADVNDDGVVNGADISAVLGFWGLAGKPLPAADITRDGIVDGADLAVLLGSWGPCQ